MKFFTRDEFECNCGCGFDTIDYELAEVMDDVRKHFGKKTTITSGCRCKRHNKNEGGEEFSKHLFGTACDFIVEGIHPDKVADYLESMYPNKYGIGRYKGRTHIDIRKQKTRWDKR